MSEWGCQDCAREWSGHTQAHCPTCCEHFTCDTAFTRHLSPASVDDPLCYDPATMTRKDGSPLFEQVRRAEGPAWRVRQDGQHPFRRVGSRYQALDRLPGQKYQAE